MQEGAGCHLSRAPPFSHLREVTSVIVTKRHHLTSHTWGTGGLGGIIGLLRRDLSWGSELGGPAMALSPATLAPPCATALTHGK